MPQQHQQEKIPAEWQKIRIFATSLGCTLHRPYPIDRQRQQQDTIMQNELHNTLTHRSESSRYQDCIFDKINIPPLQYVRES